MFLQMWHSEPPDYRQRKPFEPLRSHVFLQHSNCNWSVSKAPHSWKRQPTFSLLANQESAKVIAWQPLAMNSFMLAILFSGRQPVCLSNDCWLQSEICVCHKNWRNWTNLPV